MNGIFSGRVLSRPNYDRLVELVLAFPCSSAADGEALEGLRQLLAECTIVEPAAVPPDLVTIKSHVVLVDDQRHRSYAFTLSYPPEMPAQPSYSVLSPMGLSVLGRRGGAAVQWTCPGGQPVKTVILRVARQPEAYGFTGERVIARERHG